MLNWGSEFLDDGCYGQHEPPLSVLVWHLPTRIAAEYVDPRIWEMTWKDDVDWLQDSISEHGIHTPLLFHLDTEGNAHLKDGYHRLLAAMRVSVPFVPVVFKPMHKAFTRGFYRPFIMSAQLHLLEEWLAFLCSTQ